MRAAFPLCNTARADEDSWRIDGPGGYGDPQPSYGDRICSIDIPSCVVPEPATLALAISGAFCLAGMISKRKQCVLVRTSAETAEFAVFITYTCAKRR